MVVAGVDYSLTSPAICIHSGEDWNYSNCKFYYFVGNSLVIPAQHKYPAPGYPVL